MDEGHRAQALNVHAAMIGEPYRTFIIAARISQENTLLIPPVSHLDCPMLLYLSFLQKFLQVFFFLEIMESISSLQETSREQER